MEKTYKEIREDLARKYNDKRNELNRTLDSLHNLGYSEEEINTIRKDLINNLQDSLKSEEYYDESYSAYADEYNAQRAVNRAEEEKKQLREEYYFTMGELQNGYENKIMRLQKEYGDKMIKLQKEYMDKLTAADRNLAEKTEAYKNAQIEYRGETEGELVPIRRCIG